MSSLRTHNTRQRKSTRPLPSVVAGRRNPVSFLELLRPSMRLTSLIAPRSRLPAKAVYLHPYHLRRARRGQRNLASIHWGTIVSVDMKFSNNAPPLTPQELEVLRSGMIKIEGRMIARIFGLPPKMET